MPKPGTAKTLLILEDEILLLEIIVAKCEKAGFEVMSARSVDEALSLLTELSTVDIAPRSVDAVWLDHYLPEKNGNEFLTEFLKHKEWANTPVFLITNAVETDVVNWYLRAGVRQYFPKMTTPIEKILASINLYLQQVVQNQASLSNP